MTLHMIRDVSLSTSASSVSPKGITLGQFQTQMVQQFGSAYWQRAGSSSLSHYYMIYINNAIFTSLMSSV